jgi:hypothetical protein
MQAFKIKKVSPIDTTTPEKKEPEKPKILYDSPGASPLDYLDEFGVPLLRTRR